MTGYEYDILDRVSRVSIGVLDGSGNWPSSLTPVAESAYDGGTVSTPAIGDGHPTSSTALVAPSLHRTTLYSYDYRGRNLVVEAPAAPHMAMAYDNLGRTVARGVFSSVPTAIDDPLADRGRYEETSYSQRGLPYRSALAIDTEDASPEFLESHSWFDATGRTVGAWAPSSPMRKTTYDGLGRTVVSYLTDRRDDPAPGASGNYAAVFDAITQTAEVDDDVVVEQHGTRFIANVGVSDFATARMRTHDAGITELGALDGAGFPATKSIATYSAAWYDGALRAIRSAEFGTNAAGFVHSGAAPTVDQSNPPEPDPATPMPLVNALAYDAHGNVEYSTDPMGSVTRFYRDMLRREFLVVENYDPEHPIVYSWFGPAQIDDVPPMRWVITEGLDISEPDRNRATSFVHNGLGQVVRQAAYLVEEVPDASPIIRMQETAYIYDAARLQSSDIASNDLLAEIHYPDTQRIPIGAPTKPQPVMFDYNRQSEVVSLRDANTTQHVYSRDILGRVTLDKATVSTAIAAFQVDSRVNAIATGYDDLGRVENVRSFSDHGGGSEAIVNGAAFARDQLWRVLSIAQEHDGAVTGNSTAVSYTYETAPINSGNIARQTALVYPDSWTLTTGYGALGSVDDRISRAASLFDQAASPVDYAAYSYIGLSTPAIVDYTIPDFKLTRFHADNGATNSGSYPGLDRYGRVARQMWVDDDFAVNSSSSAVPNKPPIVSTAYTYDNTSNRIGAFDARPNSTQPLSNMYSYDGLHRLIDARRGAWTGGLATPSVSQLKGSQNWALDPLGNWNSVGTDVDGASGIASDETETRDHRDPSLAPPVNQVNELFKRKLAAATGGGKVNLDYDFAGNLLRQGLQSGGALKYTHDAWNRLVKVEFEEDEAALHPRAEYEYNGVNWRTVERTDTNTTDATHALDEMRVMLYDASWRLLESRIDNDYDPESEAPDFEEFTQHVWGLRYIDDIVATRRDLDPAEDNGHEVKMFHATDAQCSSVAVLLDNGALLERVAYSAYGVARHQWPADASGDGAVNSVDLTIVLNAFGGITSASYKSEADFNRDGTVNSADLSQVLGFAAALPEGTLSSVGVSNRVGYCGYQFAPEPATYLARNRWYEPPLGRWIERDPLGYVDGMNLNLSFLASPVSVFDPTGLSVVESLLSSLRDANWRGCKDFEFDLGSIIDRLTGGATVDGIENKLVRCTVS